MSCMEIYLICGQDKAITAKLNFETLTATKFYYIDESVRFINLDVHQLILCTLVSTILYLMHKFSKLRWSDMLDNYLKRSGIMNCSKDNASSKDQAIHAFTPEIPEILRTKLLLYDSAMSLAFLIDKRVIIWSFWLGSAKMGRNQ